MRLARAPIVSAFALASVAWLGSAGSQPSPSPAPSPAASHRPITPDKEACASAHEQAQVSRKRGHLLEAKKSLELCANPACPLLARQDCSVWVVEVDERLPTIVIEARDARGQKATAVRCTLDGERLVDGIDDRAIAINPGAHALKCELTDAAAAGAGVSSEQPLAVVEGEKRRKVDVSFEPPKPHDIAPIPSAALTASPSASTAPTASASSATLPDAPPKRAPALAITLAGVAVVGVAGFSYFGLKGLSDENQLRASCKPTCNPADADALRAKYHVADVSLGIGVLAAGVAAWLFFSDTTPSAGADNRARARVRVGVMPLPSGGGANLGVTF
jgi:hypothetical protein